MAIIYVSVAGVGFRVHERQRTRYGGFWREFGSGRFEPATVAALRSRLGPGTTFFDGGAWIGPFTLLAAALGARVVAVEADPLAVNELRANLALNPELAGRVSLLPVAIATRDGRVRLDGGRVGLGNGLTRLAAIPKAEPSATETDRGTVQAVDVRTLGLEQFTLVKLDIEGGEFAVVVRLNPSAGLRRAPLLLSLHGPDPAGCSVLRSWWLRLSAAPRQLRLAWALRGYANVYRILSNRSSETTKLRPIARFALGLRLGETELLLTD